MTEPTIRGYWERVKQRHSLENVGSDSHLCTWCGSDFPCHDRADAVAALALLDNTQEIFYLGDRYRVIFLEVVPDPAPRRQGPGRICECGHTLGCDCHKCQLCVRDMAVQNLEGGPSMFGADSND